jgi:hypothetical protein
MSWKEPKESHTSPGPSNTVLPPHTATLFGDVIFGVIIILGSHHLQPKLTTMYTVSSAVPIITDSSTYLTFPITS